MLTPFKQASDLDKPSPLSLAERTLSPHARPRLIAEDLSNGLVES
jgi:hypothetical protein